MCDQVSDNEFQKARNGALLAIREKRNSGGKFTATVIKSVDRKFPIGTQVTLQSGMGHVLCKGESEDGKECELHPLDAVQVEPFPGDFGIKGTVDQEVREALRRRRYNVSRSLVGASLF